MPEAPPAAPAPFSQPSADRAPGRGTGEFYWGFSEVGQDEGRTPLKFSFSSSMDQCIVGRRGTNAAVAREGSGQST